MKSYYDMIFHNKIWPRFCPRLSDTEGNLRAGNLGRIPPIERTSAAPPPAKTRSDGGTDRSRHRVVQNLGSR